MPGLDVLARQCLLRPPGDPVYFVEGAWRPGVGLIVPCRPPCKFAEWRTGEPVPENFHEATSGDYACARFVRPKTIDRLNQVCLPEGWASAPPVVPPRPPREARRARAARIPRPPRRPRPGRLPRLPRLARTPRAARPPRFRRDRNLYSRLTPTAGFWTQGSEAMEQRRGWLYSVPTFGRQCWLGPRGSLDAIVQRFRTTYGMAAEQALRDWLDGRWSEGHPCAGPQQTECQRRAGAVLSTIATLTGWRPPAPPEPAARPMRERIARAVARGGSLAFVFTPAAGPTTAETPPAPPPGMKPCWKLSWPGGQHFVNPGEPCPPGYTEDVNLAFHVG